MNINYKNWNAFEEGSDQFQYVIGQHPRVSELYARAKQLIDGSKFKDKIKLRMRTFRDRVWFAVVLPCSFYDMVEISKIRDQNEGELEKLIAEIESWQADIEDQTIVITFIATKNETTIPKFPVGWSPQFVETKARYHI